MNLRDLSSVSQQVRVVADVLGLDRMLLSDRRDVVVELVIRRADVSDTLALVLRTTWGSRVHEYRSYTFS
jgi:hypothetical protein